MATNFIPSEPAAAQAPASSANGRGNLGKPLLIRIATLEDLRRLPPPRLAPAGVRVDLRLAGIEGAQRERFERRLTRELAACGCREGSIGVLLYLGIVSLLAALGIFAPKSVQSSARPGATPPSLICPGTGKTRTERRVG